VAWVDVRLFTDFQENAMKTIALALGLAAALMTAAAAVPAPALAAAPPAPAPRTDETYSQNEVVQEASRFFGITTEAVAQAVEKVFSRYGRPNAYIIGNEGSGAVGVGLRYGEGNLYRKGAQPAKVYWQGPSIGFDLGANAAKSFTLVYRLPETEKIYQRFPGVEGSYYFIAGIGVNYQQAGDIVLAPMRTGVGLRAGANIGYLSYTRERNILPF
jgi:hypothetical protein